MDILEDLVKELFSTPGLPFAAFGLLLLLYATVGSFPKMTPLRHPRTKAMVSVLGLFALTIPVLLAVEERKELRASLESCQLKVKNSETHLERLENERDKLREDKRMLEGRVQQLGGAAPPHKSAPSARLASLPESCKAAKNQGFLNLVGNKGSGTYQLQPAGATKPLLMECDMTGDGGGWTLVADDVFTCSRGDGNSITARARTEILNKEGLRYSAVRSKYVRGSTWCSGDGNPSGGWGCSYNYGIIDGSSKWLYDGRYDSSRNDCRGCGFKEFIIQTEERGDSFFIVDPENYLDESEVDNGCLPEGIVFDVWVR